MGDLLYVCTSGTYSPIPWGTLSVLTPLYQQCKGSRGPPVPSKFKRGGAPVPPKFKREGCARTPKVQEGGYAWYRQTSADIGLAYIRFTKRIMIHKPPELSFLLTKNNIKKNIPLFFSGPLREALQSTQQKTYIISFFFTDLFS